MIQSLVRMRERGAREQSTWTCFLRNRAEFDFISRLANIRRADELMVIAVLGCSTGAEAFSTAWASRQSPAKVEIHASDIDRKVVEFARAGLYPIEARELVGLSQSEIGELLEPAGVSGLKVKEQWRRLIDWSVLDACDDAVATSARNHYDVILANRFLCHMQKDDARRGLRNIARMVKPGGILLVSGVDVDVRAEVTRELGFEPIDEEIEALHDGNVALIEAWPLEYYGLEPIDRGFSDWRYRYGVAFRKPTRTV